LCGDEAREREVKKHEHIHHNSHECYALKLSFPFFHEISRTMIRNVGFLAEIRSYSKQKRWGALTNVDSAQFKLPLQLQPILTKSPFCSNPRHKQKRTGQSQRACLASRCCDYLFGGQWSAFSTAARLAIAEARCRSFELHDTAYLL
jgi:hypothetical protein